MKPRRPFRIADADPRVVKRFDFAGLDLAQKVLRNRQYAPPPDIDRSPKRGSMVAQGKLGVKTGGGVY